MSMKSGLYIPMEMALRQMDLWYRTPLGNALVSAEQTILGRYFKECFGQWLLQVGGPGEVFLFPPHSTFHPVRLSPERMPVFKGPSVRASFEELPFFPESLDIVLLPHVLEFVSNPQEILAQSQIVLAPEGRLIILGFNPWSLWGVFKHYKRYASYPWRGHFRAMSRVKKWIEQEGFFVEEARTLFFRPPFQNAEKLHRWMALEALGRLLWADNGAVYIIVARKRVIPLTLLPTTLKYARSL